MRQRFPLEFWVLLFAMVAMSACTQQINYPAPIITAISPTSIPAGSPQAYLTITGYNLIQQTQAGYTLSLNGGTVPLATNQYISSNELIVTLPAQLLQNPNTIYINVTTPQPGGGTYPLQGQTPPAATIFTITPVASGVPTVTSMNPSTAVAGAAGLVLNLTGNNFVSQSTVFVNNASRNTTYFSSTSLQVDLDSSDLVTPGAVSIKVVNPPPGGGGSTPVSLNVLMAQPTISAVSPTSVLAGATSATLSVTGTGFLSQYSFVQLNGSPQLVTTTIGGSTAATALLTAGDLVNAGVNQITVLNKPPGGGISNILTYSVNPTHLLGLPVLVDLAADGSQAINGICGGAANCASGNLGLTYTTSGPSSSSTGQFVAFASVSRNLVLSDINTAADVYVRNTCLALASCTPVTALVSSDPNGNAANGASSEPTTDSTGTHAAFTSLATNLVTTVPVLNNGMTQVYWRPVCMATATVPCAITPSSNYDTQLVSISADGQSAGNGASYNPVISPDGQYVAFVSLATNLVSNITPDGINPQIYIRNTCNIATIVTTNPTNTCVPTTYLVSTPDGSTAGNGASSNPSISEDGLFVSFTSTATNLGSQPPNPIVPEVFERGTCVTTITSTTNTCVPVTMLISTPDGTTPADDASGESALSACGSVTTINSSACTSTTIADGRFVAFASTATNLVTGIGPLQQIYVRDTCLGVTVTVAQCTPSTTLVSTPDGITPANGLSEHPSASASGQFIAFSSFASNLGATVNGLENVFVRNTCLGVIPTCTTGVALASISSAAGASPANGASLVPSISADGHTVSFISTASNLVARDTNSFEDIFLGTTTY